MAEVKGAKLKRKVPQYDIQTEKRASPPQRNAGSPRPGTYGDENFRGNGILTCRICGIPYRDHPHIAPCPNLPLATGERLTVGTQRAQMKWQKEQDMELFTAERERAIAKHDELYGPKTKGKTKKQGS